MSGTSLQVVLMELVGWKSFEIVFITRTWLARLVELGTALPCEFEWLR